jgi:hypothetical protein
MQSAVFKIVILSALHDSGILVQNVGTQRSGVQFKREKIEAFGGIFFILTFLCDKQEKAYRIMDGTIVHFAPLTLLFTLHCVYSKGLFEFIEFL